MSDTTRIRWIDRDDAESAVIDEAAEILRSGGLVAFATETVYGLGADATNPEAVARIFAAKGRPSTNPLIVHAADSAMARVHTADWPEHAEMLAEQFWPGPLTLVLPRASDIPDIVTAGRDTVAIRVPEPPVVRALIARVGVPIAAPSANRSMGLSPTTAKHVADDLGDRVDLILDSGPTTIGLESTVLDLTTREPRILRPGPITAGELQHVLGGLRVREVVGDSAATDDRPLPSPGMMAVHYAPRTPAYRLEDATRLPEIEWSEGMALVVVGEHDTAGLPSWLSTFVLEDPVAAARGLYATLHECDRLGLSRILVVLPPDRPEWRAIRDRLQRATRMMGDIP